MGKNFKVNVEFTFKGTVTVSAKDKKNAELIVMSNFGAVNPKINSSDIRIIDWDFGIHPVKQKID